MAISNNELLQGFGTARSYIRGFFLYGYKSRYEFSEKDKERTHDDYRKKVQNWLSTYANQTKNINNETVHYLTLDGRTIPENPFYLPLKMRSFKPQAITMHFFLLDMLNKHPDGIETGEIEKKLKSKYFVIDYVFKHFTEDNADNMLKQYVEEGLLSKKKDGYSFANDLLAIDFDQFFDTVSRKSLANKDLLKEISSATERLGFITINYLLDNDAIKRVYPDYTREQMKEILKQCPKYKKYQNGYHNFKDIKPLLIEFLEKLLDKEIHAIECCGPITINDLLNEDAIKCFYPGYTREQIEEELQQCTEYVKYQNGSYNFQTRQPLLKAFCTKRDKRKLVNKVYTKDQMIDILEENDLNILTAAPFTYEQLINFLNEYEKLGLIKSENRNPKIWKLNPSLDIDPDLTTAIQFFAGADDLGFFGSTLLDLKEANDAVYLNSTLHSLKAEEINSPFIFKHHYLANALNTEIIYQLLEAISNRLIVQLSIYDSRRITETYKTETVVPLKLYRSTSSSRVSLLGYNCSQDRYDFFFLDDIVAVEAELSAAAKKQLDQDFCTPRITKETTPKGKTKERKTSELVCTKYDELLEGISGFTKYIWNMSTTSYIKERPQPTRVTVTFKYDKKKKTEQYIGKRIKRERRQGVVQDDPIGCTFTIKLYNPGELFPWLRSLIARIAKIDFENKKYEQQFYDDFELMCVNYDLDKEEK